jgi:hypothetical protein
MERCVERDLEMEAGLSTRRIHAILLKMREMCELNEHEFLQLRAQVI